MFILLHQIAFAASETGHTELLGVIYDELVREHWQSMSLKTRNFHLASEISEINKCYLDKAKALHDKLLGVPKVAHLVSFAQFAGVCFRLWLASSSMARSASGTRRVGTQASIAADGKANVTKAVHGKATSLSRAKALARNALSAREGVTWLRTARTRARHLESKVQQVAVECSKVSHAFFINVPAVFSSV